MVALLFASADVGDEIVGAAVTSIICSGLKAAPGFLWWRALYALGATLVLLVALRFGRRIVALLQAGFERRYRARIEGFEHKAHHIIKVEQIWRVLAGLLNLTCGLTIAVAVYVYLHYVLSLFPWTRAFANSMYRMAVDPLRTMGSGPVGIIPNLVFLEPVNDFS
jgi:hypothetical protein